MARIKYYYDTETCKYERIKISKWDVFLNMLGFFAVSMVFAIGIVFIFSKYFQSPEVSMLKRENNELLIYYQEMQVELNRMSSMIASLQERDDNIYRIIFEADPIPATVREVGIGGTDRFRALREERLQREDLIIATYERVSKLKKQMYIQTKSYDDIILMAKNKSDMLASIPSIRPTGNKARLASGYGMRFHPLLKLRRMHAGLDFSAQQGTPIYATGNGTIVKARRLGGLGLAVIIDHGYGYKTKYGHMSKFAVKQGQKVHRGDLIGYIGNTGLSAAPHVHYEVWKDGRHVNPVYYFYNDVTDKEFDELLEIASRENQSLG